jgi:uncharacterized integral membrane protein
LSLKKIILFVILIFSAVFVLQNTQTVEIQFLFWQISSIRAVVLGVTFLFGAAAGFLLKLLWKKSPEKPMK